jgi:Reverse transcriptase (RNA-dependent DNA polymerase)
VYAAKPDRLKARLVAGGHLTDTPVDSVETLGWSTDVGNAYLESFTKEKVYIIAGPKFGDRQGHTLVIVKALKASGLRWRERFADVLKEMGFSSSRAEPDIWMRDRGDHYEYIAVYVDDLLIASRQPNEIVKILEEIHKFKLKGSGPTSFHLGCDFFQDEEGVLCYAPKRYILRMLETFERLFGKQPKQYVAPLEGGDHPELDDLELLEIEDIKVYQSLIGALQWVIQIGRFDITTHVMTLSRFRAAHTKDTSTG